MKSPNKVNQTKDVQTAAGPRTDTNWLVNHGLVIDPVKKLRSIALVPSPPVGFLSFPADFQDHEIVDGHWHFTNGSTVALRFDADKKLDFLPHFLELWPNVTEACKRVGISRQCYAAHVSIDRAFSLAIQGIIDGKMDELEGQFWKYAQLPKGFMDRMVLAKAYRPERFDAEKKVRMTHETRREWSDDEAAARARMASEAVDAEIVREQFRESPPQESPHVGALGQGAINQ